MIPTIDKPEVLSSADFKEVEFGVDKENLHYLFDIMRRQIYKYPFRAVVRELYCNAYDATIQAGKTEDTIIVTIPNSLDSHFRIRDFGSGLSWEEVSSIFSKYHIMLIIGHDLQLLIYFLKLKILL
jgi:HSP90 family molecular chaperone